MNPKFVLTFGLAQLLAVASVAAQGTFQNLDFEQAKIIPLVGGPYPDSIATSNAIPGWTAYQGGQPVSSIVSNDISLGAAWVSLQGTNSPYASFFGGVIQGRYSVLLQPEFPGATQSAAIEQTGTVPINAQSLMLYANGPISALLDGKSIPLVVLGTGPNYTIYGGDVSAFAGTVRDLRLEANTISPSGWGSTLDNIMFSDQRIPEPSAVSITMLAASLFLLRQGRTRQVD